MEGFPRNRFRHGFDLCSVTPEHNNLCIWLLSLRAEGGNHRFVIGFRLGGIG